MFIELKADYERVYLKDGSLTTKKHIVEQNDMLIRLCDRGFMAVFGQGFTQTKKIIDDYMKLPTNYNNNNGSD